MCVYAHEVVQMYGLSSSEIDSQQYDLSSVQILKVAASHILPVHKRRLAELMPHLIQLTNVICIPYSLRTIIADLSHYMYIICKCYYFSNV